MVCTVAQEMPLYGLGVDVMKISADFLLLVYVVLFVLLVYAAH